MSRAQYQKAAKRFYWIVSIWTVVFASGAAWLVEVFGTAIGAYGRFIRGHLGEPLGAAASGLTLGAAALLVWLGVALVLDRRFGLRCPHCHGSLTMRSLPHRLFQTGHCALCHGRAFDEA
jgi:hypothetical protein